MTPVAAPAAAVTATTPATAGAIGNHARPAVGAGSGEAAVVQGRRGRLCHRSTTEQQRTGQSAGTQRSSGRAA
jgi:hypothetical protein